MSLGTHPGRLRGFFCPHKKSLLPVEVKAKGGKSKSLRTLIDSDKYADIKCGLKLSDGNIIGNSRALQKWGAL